MMVEELNNNARAIQYGIYLRQKANSIAKELFRKSIHICSSFVPFFLNLYFYPTIAMLGFAVCGYSVCEGLRLNGVSIPLVSKITEVAARKRDENRFVLGPVTLVFGIILAALFLPYESARVGIYALAFGDGLASLSGKLIGKITIPGSHGKTVAGSLTCFLAVFIAVFYCCNNCYASLLTAVFAMLLEMLPLSDFDNLIIPVTIGVIFKYIS